MFFFELLLTTHANLYKSLYDFKPNLGIALVTATVCTFIQYNTFSREASVVNLYSQGSTARMLSLPAASAVYPGCSAFIKPSLRWHFLSVFHVNVNFQGLPCSVIGERKNFAYGPMSLNLTLCVELSCSSLLGCRPIFSLFMAILQSSGHFPLNGNSYFCKGSRERSMGDIAHFL